MGATYIYGAPPAISPAEAKLAELTLACRAAITGGFMSAALGKPYLYPSQNTAEHPDQTNLSGSVTNALYPDLPADWTTPFWTRDPDIADDLAAWQYRMHTAPQIRQAGQDFKDWVVTCQLKLQQLAGQVVAATSTADVQAVRW